MNAYLDKILAHLSQVSSYEGSAFRICTPILNLTAVFFETGAMSTPTKSQNVTNCGLGGSFQS